MRSELWARITELRAQKGTPDPAEVRRLADGLDDLREEAQAQRNVRAQMVVHLDRHYAKAFDAFELFLCQAIRLRRVFLHRCRSIVSETERHTLAALVRLQANGCLVASEVLALLRAGHARAAHSQWRSLHELAVVARKLAAGDDAMAERFLLHEWIDRARAGQHHFNYQKDLGTPVSEEEVKWVVGNADKLKARYGKHYGDLYGWVGRGVKFRDIEEEVGLAFWRAPYTVASWLVHPSSRSQQWHPALGEGSGFLPVGPVDTGLDTPASNSVWSLTDLTDSLLGDRANNHERLEFSLLEDLGMNTSEEFNEAEVAGLPDPAALNCPT